MSGAYVPSAHCCGVLSRPPPVVGWSPECPLLWGGLPSAYCCGVVSRPPHLSNKKVRDVQISAIRTRGRVGRPPKTGSRRFPERRGGRETTPQQWETTPQQWNDMLKHNLRDCPLPTAHCPLPTAHCPLPTTHYPLPTYHCPPTTSRPREDSPPVSRRSAESSRGSRRPACRARRSGPPPTGRQPVLWRERPRGP